MTLGEFTLHFEPGGKLAELLLPGGESILHPSGNYKFPVGNDREYVVGGWDECFPTIEPHERSPVMGDLISAAPVISESAECVEQTWDTPRYRAPRTFRAPRAGELMMEFRVTSRSAAPMVFLWASHALFSTTFVRQVLWPDGTRLDDLSLNGTARKFFIDATGPVYVIGAGVRLTLTTDQPYWGIWLNRGGWPSAKPAGFACLGLEATTTGADLPGGQSLLPGAEFCGRVTLQTKGKNHDE